MLVRSTKHSRNRRAIDPANFPIGPVIDAVCTIVEGKVQIDFDQPVSVGGVPVGITVEGSGPIGYVADSQTRITLTYAPNVTVGNICEIPPNVPQIRNRARGYLIAKSTTF